jgi:hypothetical protein
VCAHTKSKTVDTSPHFQRTDRMTMNTRLFWNTTKIQRTRTRTQTTLRTEVRPSCGNGSATRASTYIHTAVHMPMVHTGARRPRQRATPPEWCRACAPPLPVREVRPRSKRKFTQPAGIGWVDDDARPCTMRVQAAQLLQLPQRRGWRARRKIPPKRRRTSMRMADEGRSQRNLSAQRRGRAQGAQQERRNKEPTCDRVRRFTAHGAGKRRQRCRRTTRDGRVEGAQWSTVAAARARLGEARPC